MKVCFTGTFKINGERVTREVLVDLATTAGHTVVPDAYYADILVLGDTGRHGVTRKLDRAVRAGVEVQSPDEFLSAL